MQGHYVRVEITRDPMEHIIKDCLAYEVPILISVHGEGRVALINGPKYPPVDVNPLEEYERLELCYGSDQSGRTWVEALYGPRHSKGLTQAIKDGVKVAEIAKDAFADEPPADYDEQDEEETPKDKIKNPDTDESGYVTAKEIRAALDAAGVKYPKKASRAALGDTLELLRALVEAEVEVPPGCDADDLIEMLADAGIEVETE